MSASLPVESAKNYIDIQLSEEQNLINLINKANMTKFTTEHLSFANPTALEVDQKNAMLRNTSVMVTALEASNKRGSRPFEYHRIHLETLWSVSLELPTVMLYGSTDASESSVKRFIQNFMRFREESIDVNIQDQDNIITVTLTAKPNSLLYVGSITLTLEKS